MKITFTVDFPITPKGRPRKGKYGFYTPSRTASCERAIRTIASLSLRSQRRGKVFEGSVRVCLLLARCRGDLDNRAKLALDALNGIAYKDDSQVKELHAIEVEGEISTITVEEL